MFRGHNLFISKVKYSTFRELHHVKIYKEEKTIKKKIKKTLEKQVIRFFALFSVLVSLRRRHTLF